MKNASFALLASGFLLCSGAALAQTQGYTQGYTQDSSGVRVSNDPAVIADVEQRAQAIQNGASPGGSNTPGPRPRRGVRHHRAHPSGATQ